MSCIVAHFNNVVETASYSGASFFARLRRATGDEPQGTMGRVKTAGEDLCALLILEAIGPPDWGLGDGLISHSRKKIYHY